MYNLLTKRHWKTNDSNLDDSLQDADFQQQTKNEREYGLNDIADELSNLTIHNGQESVTGEEEVEGNEEVNEALEWGDLMNKTIPELKESLKSWGMKLLGNKQNLVDQLLGEEGNLKQAGEEEKMKGNEEVYAEALEQSNLMNKTIPELKALLKLRGMKLTGKKSKLVDQLLGEEVDNDADLELNSVSRLNEKLKTSNKPTHCNRAELIKRLRGEEQFEEG